VPIETNPTKEKNRGGAREGEQGGSPKAQVLGSGEWIGCGIEDACECGRLCSETATDPGATAVSGGVPAESDGERTARTEAAMPLTLSAHLPQYSSVLYRSLLSVTACLCCGVLLCAAFAAVRDFCLAFGGTAAAGKNKGQRMAGGARRGLPCGLWGTQRGQRCARARFSFVCVPAVSMREQAPGPTVKRACTRRRCWGGEGQPGS
jgi:hypothetical protein